MARNRLQASVGIDIDVDASGARSELNRLVAQLEEYKNAMGAIVAGSVGAPVTQTRQQLALLESDIKSILADITRMQSITQRQMTTLGQSRFFINEAASSNAQGILDKARMTRIASMRSKTGEPTYEQRTLDALRASAMNLLIQEHGSREEATKFLRANYGRGKYNIHGWIAQNAQQFAFQESRSLSPLGQQFQQSAQTAYEVLGAGKPISGGVSTFGSVASVREHEQIVSAVNRELREFTSVLKDAAAAQKLVAQSARALHAQEVKDNRVLHALGTGRWSGAARLVDDSRFELRRFRSLGEDFDSGSISGLAKQRQSVEAEMGKIDKTLQDHYDKKKRLSDADLQHAIQVHNKLKQLRQDYILEEDKAARRLGKREGKFSAQKEIFDQQTEEVRQAAMLLKNLRSGNIDIHSMAQDEVDQLKHRISAARTTLRSVYGPRFRGMDPMTAKWLSESRDLVGGILGVSGAEAMPRVEEMILAQQARVSSQSQLLHRTPGWYQWLAKKVGMPIGARIGFGFKQEYDENGNPLYALRTNFGLPFTRLPDEGDGNTGRHPGSRAYGRAYNTTFNRLNHLTTNFAQMSGTSLYGLGLIGAGTALVGGTFKAAAELQTIQLTLGGIVNTYAEFTDLQGQSITGADKLNKSLAYSKDLYEKIREKAKSSLLTPKELAENFMSGGAQLLGKGFNPDQALNIVDWITKLGRAQGFSSTMIMSDIRDVARGSVNSRSQVLMSAGLNKEGLERAKRGGAAGIYEYVREKFEPFEEVFRQIDRTPQGQLNKLRIELEQTAQALGAELAPTVISMLVNLRAVVSEWVQSGRAATFVKSIGDLAAGLVEVFGFITDKFSFLFTDIKTTLVAGLTVMVAQITASIAAQTLAMKAPIAGLLITLGGLVAGLLALKDQADARRGDEVSADFMTNLSMTPEAVALRKERATKIAAEYGYDTGAMWRQYGAATRAVEKRTDQIDFFRKLFNDVWRYEDDKVVGASDKINRLKDYIDMPMSFALGLGFDGRQAQMSQWGSGLSTRSRYQLEGIVDEFAKTTLGGKYVKDWKKNPELRDMVLPKLSAHIMRVRELMEKESLLSKDTAYMYSPSKKPDAYYFRGSLFDALSLSENKAALEKQEEFVKLVNEEWEKKLTPAERKKYGVKEAYFAKRMQEFSGVSWGKGMDEEEKKKQTPYSAVQLQQIQNQIAAQTALTGALPDWQFSRIPLLDKVAGLQISKAQLEYQADVVAAQENELGPNAILLAQEKFTGALNEVRRAYEEQYRAMVAANMEQEKQVRILKEQNQLKERELALQKKESAYERMPSQTPAEFLKKQAAFFSLSAERRGYAQAQYEFGMRGVAEDSKIKGLRSVPFDKLLEQYGGSINDLLAGEGLPTIAAPNPSTMSKIASAGGQFAVSGLVDQLAAKFKLSPTSIFRPGAKIKGTNRDSLHAFGRAADFGLSKNSTSDLDAAWKFLTENAESLGLQEVIWKDKIWKKGKIGKYSKGDHMDHLHAGVAENGAVTLSDVFAKVSSPEFLKKVKGSKAGAQAFTRMLGDELKEQERALLLELMFSDEAENQKRYAAFGEQLSKANAVLYPRAAFDAQQRLSLIGLRGDDLRIAKRLAPFDSRIFDLQQSLAAYDPGGGKFVEFQEKLQNIKDSPFSSVVAQFYTQQFASEQQRLKDQITEETANRDNLNKRLRDEVALKDRILALDVQRRGISNRMEAAAADAAFGIKEAEVMAGPAGLGSFWGTAAIQKRFQTKFAQIPLQVEREVAAVKRAHLKNPLLSAFVEINEKSGYYDNLAHQLTQKYSDPLRQEYLEELKRSGNQMPLNLALKSLGGNLASNIGNYALGNVDFGAAIPDILSPFTQIAGSMQGDALQTLLAGGPSKIPSVADAEKDPHLKKFVKTNKNGQKYFDKKAMMEHAGLQLAAQMIGNYGGAMLGQGLFPGKDPGSIGMGSQLGTAVGGIWGTSVFATLGTAAGPVGAIVGGLLGGVLGGLFGGKKKDPAEEMRKQRELQHQRNVEALLNNINHSLRPQYDVYRTIRGAVLFGAASGWYSGRAYAAIGVQASVGGR